MQYGLTASTAPPALPDPLDMRWCHSLVLNTYKATDTKH